MKNNAKKFPLPTGEQWSRLPERVKKLEALLSTTYTREVITLPVPEVGDTVTVELSALDTVILFDGDLIGDFTFLVNTTNSIAPGCRIYMMVKGTGEILMGENLNPVSCGDSEGTIMVQSNMVCHEMIFDGNQFTGIDNC